MLPRGGILLNLKPYTRLPSSSIMVCTHKCRQSINATPRKITTVIQARIQPRHVHHSLQPPSDVFVMAQHYLQRHRERSLRQRSHQSRESLAFRESRLRLPSSPRPCAPYFCSHASCSLCLLSFLSSFLCPILSAISRLAMPPRTAPPIVAAVSNFCPLPN
jgi:hypothetical protein